MLLPWEKGNAPLVQPRSGRRANVPMCAPVVFLLSLLLRSAMSKGSARTAHSGTVTCPCFCSAREDSTNNWATFWDDEFELVAGEDKGAAPLCGAGAPGGGCRSAASAAAALSFCGRYITYPFCARQLQNSTFSLGDLDASAKLCVQGTPWQEGTACWDTVARGACAFAFPRCAADAAGGAPAALPVCTHQCVAERAACRTWGSSFGSLEGIRRMCEGATETYRKAEPRVGLCSHAPPQVARGVWCVAGPALAVTATLLARPVLSIFSS